MRQIIRVSKFWREYAGALAVETIDDKVMREFIPWRRDYYSTFKVLPKNAKLHPTDRTIQFDMMIGKAIIRWAHEQGVRGKQALPTVTFTPKKKRVRPAFERSEFRALWRILYKRIKTARDKRIKKSRELLRDYVLVIAHSGLRPGEANDLTVRDIHPFKDEKGRSNYRLVVRGDDHGHLTFRQRQTIRYGSSLNLRCDFPGLFERKPGAGSEPNFRCQNGLLHNCATAFRISRRLLYVASLLFP